jgi:uncharacterized protein (DUF302 family)
MTTTQQKYGIETTVDLSYDDAIEKVTAAMKEEGFGVLTEIDVKATLKEKIDADFRRYVILGACNPHFAHRALQAEIDIGMLMPCNVIVYEADDGKTVVAAMDPGVMSQVSDNPELPKIAAEARERVQRAIASLGGQSA